MALFRGVRELDFLALLTAFGVGSIVTAIIQFWLSARATEKQRMYDERKEAYVGLLHSWKEYESKEPSDEGAFEIGHWLLRAQLVAPKPTLLHLNRWEETPVGSQERIEATRALKSAMRKDLCSF
jgi:hypothetical protein